MYDIQVLGDDLQNIFRADLACRDFEATSGALLNRNSKMTIVTLGSLVVHQDWPLQWILSSFSVKVLGFTISPIFHLTVQLSWDHILYWMERMLQSWRTRRLETLQQRVQVLGSSSSPRPDTSPSPGHLSLLPQTMAKAMLAKQPAITWPLAAALPST